MRAKGMNKCTTILTGSQREIAESTQAQDEYDTITEDEDAKG
jgi:hypothetical protein